LLLVAVETAELDLAQLAIEDLKELQQVLIVSLLLAAGLEVAAVPQTKVIEVVRFLGQVLVD
jgi:hypothetical protein